MMLDYLSGALTVISAAGALVTAIIAFVTTSRQVRTRSVKISIRTIGTKMKIEVYGNRVRDPERLAREIQEMVEKEAEKDSTDEREDI